VAPARAVENDLSPSHPRCGRFYLREPGLAKQAAHLLAGVEAVDATGKLGCGLLVLLRPESQHQAPAGFHDPVDLAQVPLRVRPEVEGVDGADLVEAVLGVRNAGAVALLDLDALLLDVPSVSAARHTHHRLGEIHTGDETFRNHRRSALHGAPVAATDVENTIGRLQSEEIQRVRIRWRGFNRHDLGNQPAQQPRGTTALPGDERRPSHRIPLLSLLRASARRR
jgi:hypothetical protein